MKAVRIHKFGSPEVIIWEDLLKPEPGEGEILIEVKAAGVGPWDALVRSAAAKSSLKSTDPCASLLLGGS